MKSLLLIVNLILINTFCSAQRITYFDLNKLLKSDVAQTEEMLSKKGFNFNKVDTTGEKNNLVNYVYAKYVAGDIKYMGIDKTYQDDIAYQVSFFTNLKSDYLSLLELVKKNGFIAQKSETYNGDLILIFKKKGLEFNFMIHRDSDKHLTQYYITLYDVGGRWAAYNL